MVSRIPLGDGAQQVIKNVRRLRHEQRWTVRSLAKRLRELDHPLANSAVSKIEMGHRRVDVDDLFALARAFEVEPAELLASDPPAVRPQPANALLPVCDRCGLVIGNAERHTGACPARRPVAVVELDENGEFGVTIPAERYASWTEAHGQPVTGTVTFTPTA